MRKTTARKVTAMFAALMASVGVVGVAGPASAEPSRRVIVSGSIHQLDDDTFGRNPTCDHLFFDNDIVTTSQQLIYDDGKGCEEEVYTQIIAYADLMSGGAIRYHGTVILREGGCGCPGDQARASKGFNQVILPDTNARIDSGYLTWSGGDATSVVLQVYNGNP
ncbi:hypothetical protein [Nonomuraea sp. NPDC050643]|uniref:hypothetical protein n=1 Tax=Nonomuraea sp. NPDC050643 TaxID=3155660 RepID=UPI0033DA6ADA